MFAAIQVLWAAIYGKMEGREATLNVIYRLGLFMLIGLISTHLMRAVIIRLKTVKQLLAKQVAQFFFLSTGFSLLAGGVYYSLCRYWDLLNGFERAFIDRFIIIILSTAFYFFILIFIWILVYFIVHYIAQERKTQTGIAGFDR